MTKKPTSLKRADRVRLDPPGYITQRPVSVEDAAQIAKEIEEPYEIPADDLIPRVAPEDIKNAFTPAPDSEPSGKLREDPDDCIS